MTTYDPDAILADPNSHPIHRRIAEINIRIRDHGEHWGKCANCGELYQMTPEWSSETVCSKNCYNSFRDDLLSDRGWV